MEQYKAQIMDAAAVGRCITRISHEIIERNKGVEELCVIGIKRRGVPIARQICGHIERIEGTRIPCGTVDINFYRDDLTTGREHPEIKKIELPFPVEGRRVVLVDDVLFTGRTVRAAIDAVFSVGRPKAIQLAILIDRGHRELPIRADFIGKNIPTSRAERVAVCLPPYDGETGVFIYERPDTPGI